MMMMMMMMMMMLVNVIQCNTVMPDIVLYTIIYTLCVENTHVMLEVGTVGASYVPHL